MLRTVLAYPRELWAMLLLKALLAYSYFCLAATLVVYATTEHGYTDMQAASLYSTWGILMSVVQFCCGPLIDRLQIRRSLVVGTLINSIGMFAIALAFDSRPTLLIALFGAVPIGSALGLAVLDIGTKRYAPRGSMNMAFAIAYSSVNIGAAATGATIELVRDRYGPAGVKYRTYNASVERFVILLAAAVTAIAGLVAALVVRDDPPARETELMSQDDDNEPLPAQRCAWLRNDVLPVLRNASFRRLFVFSLTTIGVRLVYRHIDATFPKVIMRAFGDDAHYGALYSINPALVIFLTPLIGAVTARFDIYTVIVVGTLISALSMFIMASEMTLLSVVVWAVAFTLGDAIFSPLIAVYIMAIAPDQREGLYTSLVSAPNLLAKAFVGPMSGELLDLYCPKDGPYTQCNRVWLYVGFGALSTPLLLAVLRRYIHSGVVASRLAAVRHQTE